MKTIDKKWYIKKCIEYPCWDYLFWNSLPLYKKKKISPVNGNPFYKLYWYTFKEREYLKTSIFLTKKNERNLYMDIITHNNLKNKYYGIKGLHKKIIAWIFYRTIKDIYI